MHSHLIKQENALQFILAGKSIVTCKSVKTGNRFTYKIEQAKNKKPIWFVKVLTGPTNTTNYTYFAFITDYNNQMELKFGGKKTKISQSATSYKAFEYIFNHLRLGINMPNIELWHEGRCCKCGKLLTDDESIKRGFGPICAAFMAKRGMLFQQNELEF